MMKWADFKTFGIPLLIAALFGAFIVAVAWVLWCGWYFNGH